MKLDADTIHACIAAETDQGEWGFDRDQPLGCAAKLAGTGTANQPCIYDAQCSSGFCQKGRNAMRGFCAMKAPSNVGDPCVFERCAGGLACSDGICVARKPAKISRCGGGPCGGTKKLGAKCNPDQDDFLILRESCAPELTCASTTRKCVKLQFGEIGAPCGENGCRASHCVEDRCEPYVRDGEVCAYNECAPPARCFDGQCAIDPAPKSEL
jgi:hypothetical protein